MTASPDFTAQLQAWMQQAHFKSFKALSQQAQVSEKQLRHLRQGNWARVKFSTVIQVSQALQIPVSELVVQATSETPPAKPATSETAIQQEYQRLQQQLLQQRETLWQEFQQTCLQTLESWMLLWPTAAHAAQQNPQAPAVKLLPLLRPVEKLLEQWGIQTISPVGSEVAYDPHHHQLIEGSAQPGDRVRVSHAGYRQGSRLLFRGKVKAIPPG